MKCGNKTVIEFAQQKATLEAIVKPKIRTDAVDMHFVEGTRNLERHNRR